MNTHDTDARGYLSKQKAAIYADISLRTLDYAVERGELPAFRLILKGTHSRKLLFRKSDLDAWIARYRIHVNLDAIVDEVVTEVVGDVRSND